MNSNYENAKIYKIVDNTSDMIYVGSTYQTLEQRLKEHEKDYKRFKAGKYNNVSSFKILENNNYKIELVKNYPCENKKNLELEEGKIIKQYRNDGLNIVNRCIVGQTDAEYYQNNKNKIKEYRQKINKIQKEQNICSCGGKFTHQNKSHHEKSKKHQDYINNSKIINIETININITVNNLDELKQLELDFLNAIK